MDTAPSDYEGYEHALAILRLESELAEIIQSVTPSRRPTRRGLVANDTDARESSPHC